MQPGRHRFGTGHDGRSVRPLFAAAAALAARVGRLSYHPPGCDLRPPVAGAGLRWTRTRHHGPASFDAPKRECARASFFLLGRNAQAHPPLARPHVFAPAAQPHAAGRRRGRDRSRLRRGRHRALSPLRARTEDAVLPFSRLCLLGGLARPDRATRHRGVRRRPVGKRWGPDDAAAAAATRARPPCGEFGAESCCSTTPRRRPRPCFRPSCAPSRTARYRRVHVVPASE